MTENDGVTKFLEYLDLLKDEINSFEHMVCALDIVGKMPVSDEQIEAINRLMELSQEKWNKDFLDLLKYGVKWLESQKR